MAGMLAIIAGCATTRDGRALQDSPEYIENALRQHVDILASAGFGGRRPGTEGERKTLRYLADAWEAAGLQSGTNDPSNPWLAPVELAVRKPIDGTISFKRDRARITMPGDEARIFTSGRRALMADAPLIFVGREAESIDRPALSGRVALMMWDHPDRHEQRQSLFERGAAAVIAIVLEPAEFAQLVRIREAGAYRLAVDEAETTVEGFLSQRGARQLLGADGLLDLLREAEEHDFSPVDLDLTANIEASSSGEALRTHNLIAKLPGSKPDGGAVMLVAHWDHFGLCGDPESGSALCGGAVDNASGLAVITETAKRLARDGELDRDVYFVATTAEEWGLLGAQALARDPPVPLDSIVAAFNLDSVGIADRGGKVAVVGEGLTGLDPEIDAILVDARRERVKPDHLQGLVRRQDGWALLQRDVPALMISSAFGDRELFARYVRERYHSPADRPDLVKLGGASEDLLLHLALVRHFASVDRHPGRRAGL